MTLFIEDISRISDIPYTGENLRIDGLDYADSPRTGGSVVTFCNNRAYLKKINETPRAVALFCPVILVGSVAQRITVFLTPDPAGEFYHLHNALYEQTDFYDSFKFSPIIGRNCRIHERAVIKDGVVMGDDVVIEAGAVIEKGAVIGNRVVVGANSVVGAEGNATNYRVRGRLVRIRHAGGVVIGEDTVIGANCTVSKNVLNGMLEIGARCQIDNCVHIGHNAIIEDECVFSAGTVVCGGAVIRKGCYLAPGTVVRDKIELGERTRTHLGAVIVQKTQPDAVMAGFYAMPHHAWMMKTKEERQVFGS